MLKTPKGAFIIKCRVYKFLMMTLQRKLIYTSKFQCHKENDIYLLKLSSTLLVSLSVCVDQCATSWDETCTSNKTELISSSSPVNALYTGCFKKKWYYLCLIKGGLNMHKISWFLDNISPESGIFICFGKFLIL